MHLCSAQLISLNWEQILQYVEFCYRAVDFGEDSPFDAFSIKQEINPTPSFHSLQQCHKLGCRMHAIFAINFTFQMYLIQLS